MMPRLAHVLLLPLAVLGITGRASMAVAGSPTLDKIRTLGTITLGYREASIPFSYLGTAQSPTGMSLDLCAAVAQHVSAALNLPDLKLAYVPVTASNRIPLLQNGTIDIECGSTTNTVERQKQVAFTVATFVSQPRWLTLRTSGIADVKDLRGRTVVITQGSLNMLLAQKLNAAEGLDLKIIQARDHAESLLMLRTGRASAWYEDDVLLAGARATAPEPDSLKFLPAASGGNFYYYGLMLRREDPEFKALVDDVLKQQMASGVFTKLYQRWFMNPIPPHGLNLDLPMSEALQTRIKEPSDVLAP
ncbi:transporter substrate-binding domain-containing protein [Methylobacterium sp. ID0610]|uniref:transporter substrate-binding domain-containing protein n=1 Tax=Methylobacterium carpenticola TaxID=3344827 RepID=UPI003694F9BF